MSIDELFEEIRSLLSEPQLETVGDAFQYDDVVLGYQSRSAIRGLNALGLTITETISAGPPPTLSAALDETEGELIALSVASQLLRGDLVQKLHDGDIGIMWKEDSSTIDTKTAAIQFSASAALYEDRFRTLLTIHLSDPSRANAAQSVLGSPNLSA